jgi:two-component sensor histidine kinase
MGPRSRAHLLLFLIADEESAMNHQRLEASDIRNFPPAAGHESPRSRTGAEDLPLLLHEFNHRVRNLLAMIEAVVRQTQSGSVDDYREKVLTRLSGFHDFYEVVGWWDRKKVALAHLLKQTMGSFCSNGGQVVASGADVDLEPDLALALHLVFHELAMNASKYGALTTASGCVTVDWKLHATGSAPPKLAVIWSERGGPEVHDPVRRGFGSRIIARALDGYGEVQINFLPTGVTCYILIDLDRKPRSPA